MNKEAIDLIAPEDRNKNEIEKLLSQLSSLESELEEINEGVFDLNDEAKEGEIERIESEMSDVKGRIKVLENKAP